MPEEDVLGQIRFHLILVLETATCDDPIIPASFRQKFVSFCKKKQIHCRCQVLRVFVVLSKWQNHFLAILASFLPH